MSINHAARAQEALAQAKKTEGDITEEVIALRDEADGAEVDYYYDDDGSDKAELAKAAADIAFEAARHVPFILTEIQAAVVSVSTAKTEEEAQIAADKAVRLGGVIAETSEEVENAKETAAVRIDELRGIEADLADPDYCSDPENPFGND